MSNIKFFPLDHDSINKNEVYEDNTHFNKALQSIVEKDINLLNKKLEGLRTRISKTLALAGCLPSEKIEYDIYHIDDFISFLEIKVGDIIIEKGSIKVGVFSSNKKLKRDRILSLEGAINTLHNYQDELLILKKEYDKIVKRKDTVDGVSFETKNIPVVQDPLERTVNFYINKQETSN